MFDTDVSLIAYAFDFLKLIFIYWLVVTVIRFFAAKDEKHQAVLKERARHRKDHNLSA
ncbi:MAG: hypothetical protein ACRED0_04360 [Gammaproteobacteria bacterium]